MIPVQWIGSSSASVYNPGNVTYSETLGHGWIVSLWNSETDISNTWTGINSHYRQLMTTENGCKQLLWWEYDGNIADDTMTSTATDKFLMFHLFEGIGDAVASQKDDIGYDAFSHGAGSAIYVEGHGEYTTNPTPTNYTEMIRTESESGYGYVATTEHLAAYRAFATAGPNPTTNWNSGWSDTDGSTVYLAAYQGPRQFLTLGSKREPHIGTGNFVIESKSSTVDEGISISGSASFTINVESTGGLNIAGQAEANEASELDSTLSVALSGSSLIKLDKPAIESTAAMQIGNNATTTAVYEIEPNGKLSISSNTINEDETGIGGGISISSAAKVTTEHHITTIASIQLSGTNAISNRGIIDMIMSSASTVTTGTLCKFRLKANQVDRDVGFLFVPLNIRSQRDNSNIRFIGSDQHEIEHLDRGTDDEQIKVLLNLRPLPDNETIFYLEHQ